MLTFKLTSTLIEHGDLGANAANHNNGQTRDVGASPRVLVALQDPEARRGMSQALCAKGFRAIALDEPFAAWNMVAEHASPRLPGFDFVICGSFHRDGDPDTSRARSPGTRFFLLLGRHGFVPFAADGNPPPVSAFRRAGTGLVLGEPAPPSSATQIGRPLRAIVSQAAPPNTQ
jgi:hypothetical protein